MLMPVSTHTCVFVSVCESVFINVRVYTNFYACFHEIVSLWMIDINMHVREFIFTDIYHFYNYIKLSIFPFFFFDWLILTACQPT